MNSNAHPTGDSPSKSPAELALEIYNLLSPHSSDTRRRAIQSAMTALGESEVLPKESAAKGYGSAAQIDADFEDLNFGPKALKWVQKHGITRAMLDEVFYLSDSKIDISASSVPGASKREKTVNTYLLAGLRGLLKDDVSSFDDGYAISECRRMAAYDKNNHTANRQSMGNKMSGSRPNFTLTGPGETVAAELLKQMAT